MRVLFCMAVVAMGLATASADANAAPRRGKHIETNIRFSERAVANIAGRNASRAAAYFGYLRLTGS